MSVIADSVSQDYVSQEFEPLCINAVVLCPFIATPGPANQTPTDGRDSFARLLHLLDFLEESLVEAVYSLSPLRVVAFIWTKS